MNFYIVRHGETLFNVTHRVQGQCDSPLTNKGIAQAKALGIGLKDIPFACAYSSTSERAYDTAYYIVAGKNIDIIRLKSLKELYFGTWEGSKERDLPIDKDTPLDYLKSFGGESIPEATNRFTQALLDIAAKQKETDHVLIVSHGAIISFFLQAVATPEWKNKLHEMGPIENGSVSLVHVQNQKFTIESVSDTSYRS